MRRHGDLRVEILTRGENLVIAPSAEVEAERRHQRRVFWRNLIVGVIVGLAILAFGAYCAQMNSAPWRQ